jgi:para-nitrobenzyl esterase
VADGRVLPESPPRALQRRGLPVPLIIGTNSDEGVLVRYYGMTPEQAIPWLGGNAERIKSAYGALTADPAAFARRLYRDVKFAAPARRLASLGRPGARTWLYRFDYVPAALRSSSPGAAHGSEVSYIFGSKDPGVSSEDRTMSAVIQKCWIAFAKARDPRAEPACAGWESYGSGNDPWFFFDTRSRLEREVDRKQLDAVDAEHRATIGRAAPDSVPIGQGGK